jgi:hypothetical protein
MLINYHVIIIPELKHGNTVQVTGSLFLAYEEQTEMNMESLPAQPSQMLLMFCRSSLVGRFTLERPLCPSPCSIFCSLFLLRFT